MTERQGVEPSSASQAERSGPLESAAAYPTSALRRRISGPIFLAAIALGIVLRLWVSSFGYNYDVSSYAIVAGISEAGGNVYAETHRYNYGPVWLQVIRVASALSKTWEDEVGFFLLFLTSLLTLTDLGICLVLKRRAGDGVALLFFLNPVSIIISGFHRQFGNLALLMGLVAADLFDQADENRLDSKKWLGMAFLGLSLATKHLLFALPLWLAVKQRHPLQKLAVLTVPLALFLFSFAPYWSTGSRGIIDNVFFYRSFQNAPFWFGLMPPVISSRVPAVIGFLSALVVAGFVFRRLPALQSTLLYTAVLVIFSPAMANQYMALVMPYAAWFFNPFGALFTAVGTVLLSVSADGLALSDAVSLRWILGPGFAILVAPLFLSLLWIFFRREIVAATRGLIRWLARELHELLRL